MAETRQYVSTEISIPCGEVVLRGNLVMPNGATALVIFSHGSGSNRFSPRNGYVAGVLQEQGFATLLVDVISSEEDQQDALHFDIDTLTYRLYTLVSFIQDYPATRYLTLGFFGSSTGAASALKAAALLDGRILTVVSRGGRPDLAEEALENVSIPVLLIVGSLDFQVKAINQSAYNKLKGERKLVIVDGATHLFEERGKLEEVARIASIWFRRYLAGHRAGDTESEV